MAGTARKTHHIIDAINIILMVSSSQGFQASIEISSEI